MELWKSAFGTRESKISAFDGKKNLFTPARIQFPSGKDSHEISVTLDSEELKKRCVHTLVSYIYLYFFFVHGID